MLIYNQKRTHAASAMENASAIAISGIIPESNFGGIETSAPRYINGETFILYRMNHGIPDHWHRARVQESRKGYYFVAYGRRKYLSEVLRVPSLKIPKRF